ncbi:MAG TPA: M56 family metallopeptidase [Candidatus Angelobacter sp.]
MIILTIAPIWSSAWPPLANHLWQSTLFAAAAGLLTLALRKNHAQVRYSLWLAASLKFLVPFSLLVTLGSHLPWPNPPAIAQSQVSIVVEEVSQPFATALRRQTPAPAPSTNLLPAILSVVWLGGCLALLLFWCLRWRRMTAALRGSLPPDCGRELEALRRLEQPTAITRPTGLVISESALEPGIVGVFRPVMLLPTGIGSRLTDAQLDAIITHELCHVRRRDNLAAALHMLVEALFWFHPLVWWIGARMVQERERACDEEVLRLGSEPQAYAESILKVCEFYLESPLVCVAGVTGSNLKKRIEAIMIQRIARKLEFGKKLLLAALGAAVFAVPVVSGLLHPAASEAQSAAAPAEPVVFESVSIKPKTRPAAGEVVRTRMLQQRGAAEFSNVSLLELVKFAYHLNDSQISGAPSWASSNLYDISIRTRESASDGQVALALQNLLTDRFKLAVHRAANEVPAYELVVGKDGPKLTEVQREKGQLGNMSMQPGQWIARGMKMGSLVGLLERQTGRPVIDKTGLNGTYDFTLTVPNWTGPARTSEAATPLLQAVSEQLGLELNSQTSLVETLVIDHAEPVADNQ